MQNLLNKPLWQMTGGDFVSLVREAGLNASPAVESAAHRDDGSGKYVYGIDGLARLLGCSRPTACRIKKSGKIDRAIRQIGRKIIIDSELAMALIGERQGGRRKR